MSVRLRPEVTTSGGGDRLAAFDMRFADYLPCFHPPAASASRLRNVAIALFAVAVAIFLPACARSASESTRLAPAILSSEPANPRVPHGFRTVIIDAGHGGRDMGGRGNGLTEKRLTLDTAFALRDELRARGFNTILTRTDDRFIELDDRVDFANRCKNNRAILVSIHYDSSGPSARGITTFFWRTDSHGLGTRVHRAVTSTTSLPSVGVVRRRMRLTRNPEIPCILVECGFMTSRADASCIASAAFRRRIAAGIASGIADQFRLGDGNIPPVPELNEPLSRATDPRTY